MRLVIIVHALLILVSLISLAYSLVSYHTCPENRNHRPLILPIFCSLAWFLVAIDSLVAQVQRVHGSTDGVVIILLVCVTLAALIYFAISYSKGRHKHETQRETCSVHRSAR